MARNGDKEKDEKTEKPEKVRSIHPDTKKSVFAVIFLALAVIFMLSSFGKAGPAGGFLFKIFGELFGVGYYLLPATLFFVAMVFFMTERQKVLATTIIGAVVFILAGLGLIDIVSPRGGGLVGSLVGTVQVPFGYIAGIVITGSAVLASALVTLNAPIKLKNPLARTPKDATGTEGPLSAKEEKNVAAADAENDKADHDAKETDEEMHSKITEPKTPLKKKAALISKALKNYVAPPLELLKSAAEKPTAGDLRANANIIKRTLASFGIPVEMGEINIGPKVTRYTLKPAEGVKLAKIIILNQDLALALAAHPIRIEAPIPGKSLVGIEVPNKAAAIVRLGSLMAYPDFNAQALLGFVLGRDVTGEPIFANIEKMPHLLIAGATGSGKSVMIHSLIISLLYKNSPATLKLILIDPKRVELTVYENIPHLVSPVITEAKKAINVFRWALSEMDRRYELLQKAGSRDITSYNANGGKDEPLPPFA